MNLSLATSPQQPWASAPLFNVSIDKQDTSTFQLGPIKKVDNSGLSTTGTGVRAGTFHEVANRDLKSALIAAQVLVDQEMRESGYKSKGEYFSAVMQSADGAYYISDPISTLAILTPQDKKWWGNDKRVVDFTVTSTHDDLVAVATSRLEPFVFNGEKSVTHHIVED